MWTQVFPVRQLPRRFLAGLAGALLLGAPALAEYPERIISLIVAYGPGGATDIAARTLTAVLDPQVAEPILVVNRTGNGGVSGTASVLDAGGDGYTMLVARVGSHSVNPALHADLPYTLDDFRFVGVFELNPVVCATHPESGLDSMAAVAEQANDEPGSVSFSSSGVGSLLHLAGAMVLKTHGVDNPMDRAIHLPLRGGGEAATAVLSGDATFICANSSALASFIQNGQLQPLLSTSETPLEGFEAPTVAELGHPELEILVGWSAIAGPADLSDEAASAWARWLGEIVENPDFVGPMEARGSVVTLMSPEASVDFIRTQKAAFAELVTRLGMRAEEDESSPAASDSE